MQSEEGAGSKFHFTLFLDVDKDAPPMPQPKIELADVRTLIVDHSEVNRRILREQVAVWRMRADVARIERAGPRYAAQSHA